MPELKRAELIEGVVYLASPVSFVRHGQPHALLAGWLAVYASRVPHVLVGDNATVRLDLDNEPQPDLLLRIAAERGGRSRVDAEGYVAGPPELIAEVAASSASYDLHDKLRVYRRSGVLEYLIWRVEDRAVDWFVLEDDRYEPIAGEGGVVRSVAFPGLWLDTKALLDGDLAKVLECLERGLAGEPSRAFRARLGGC